jgi:hypothetical protein
VECPLSHRAGLRVSCCNPSKTYLVVKAHLLKKARKLFKGTGVNVVDGAHRDLGAAIGSLPGVMKFVEEKVQKWVQRVEKFAEVARVQPHAAYAAYIAGLSHTWTYTQRTMDHIAPLFEKLREAIQRKLIPAVFDERDAGVFGENFLSLLALSRTGMVG